MPPSRPRRRKATVDSFMARLVAMRRQKTGRARPSFLKQMLSCASSDLCALDSYRPNGHVSATSDPVRFQTPRIPVDELIDVGLSGRRVRSRDIAGILRATMIDCDQARVLSVRRNPHLGQLREVVV